MKSIKITLEPSKRIDKLVQFYEDGKLVRFEFIDGMMSEVDKKITEFFYPA